MSEAPTVHVAALHFAKHGKLFYSFMTDEDDGVSTDNNIPEDAMIMLTMPAFLIDNERLMNMFIELSKACAVEFLTSAGSTIVGTEKVPYDSKLQ